MTPHDSLRWRLRDATSDAHARLDATVGDAFADVAGYTAFLRGMQRFLASAAAATGDRGLAPARAALAADLHALHADAPEPPAAAPVDAATAIGWRYVVAGSSLGARILVPRARALGFDERHGARYLALQASGGAWREFLAMPEPMLTACGSAAAIAGAHAAFACAQEAMAGAFAGVHA